MIFFFFLFACSNASSDLSHAKKLEEEGRIIEAFDVYVSIKRQYPRTSASKQAERSLKKIYLEHAISKTESEPDTAIAVYEKIIKRWPKSKMATVAAEEISKIKTTKVEKERKSNDEDLFCSKAKEAGSRVLWQQYKQNHPAGDCLEEAEAFLSSSQPRERELEEMRLLTVECSQALVLSCSEYNLPQTTSIDNACDNPNNAFQTEFSRLLRRKDSLLAEGNQEYYENFIPKRWDSVAKGVGSACASSNTFLQEQTDVGIDIEPLREILSGSCKVCLEKYGDIREL